jgi:hypothetical protein
MDMENSMDKRLRQLLESYGADKGRWPEADCGLPLEDDSAIVENARVIDRILAMASQPAVPDGAVARLLDGIAGQPEAQVIPFRPAVRRRTGISRYGAAIPLAASLALGIYLGAQGSLDFMLPASITGGGVASIEYATDDLGGVGEADAYAEENLT